MTLSLSLVVKLFGLLQIFEILQSGGANSSSCSTVDLFTCGGCTDDELHNLLEP